MIPIEVGVVDIPPATNKGSFVLLHKSVLGYLLYDCSSYWSKLEYERSFEFYSFNSWCGGMLNTFKLFGNCYNFKKRYEEDAIRQNLRGRHFIGGKRMRKGSRGKGRLASGDRIGRRERQRDMGVGDGWWWKGMK